MKNANSLTPNHLRVLAFLAFTTQSAYADPSGWSIVPYVGASQIEDQAGSITATDDISDGAIDVQLDSGFVAGLGLRYDYKNSPWSAEFAWEYRSNDSSTTASNGAQLPEGNYASNIFAINGRYSFSERGALTPWIGAGLSYAQEIDLDSEDVDGERSFASSGAVGIQVMAGFNYALSQRFYLSSELRYSSLAGLDLDEEGGAGRVSDIDYQPLTLGLGIGYRF